MKAFQLTSTQRLIIEDTLSILQNPETWTTHVSARNAAGNPVSAKSPEATCWCFYGAIQKSDSDCRSEFNIPTNAMRIFEVLKDVAREYRASGEGISLVEVNEGANYSIKNAQGVVVHKREAAVRVCELALELDTSQKVPA